jgi:glycosyltransferase involved in cell wall biosynthesis
MQSASVAILLCTFNGARFLPLQLASYEAQDFTDWRLVVSDDGSQDATLAILERFRKSHGDEKVQIRRGPRRGFVANFLSLICDPAIAADYYALSDQDDIWEPHKLSRARAVLMDAAAAAPDRLAVYCSRTRLIDAGGADLGLSRLYRRRPHFRNALAQSLASGNTMVLDPAARRLVMRAGADAEVPSHDWWIYLLVTAAGGRMIYDAAPMVRYRMHARNVMGANDFMAAKIRRAVMLWRGCYRSWADMNVSALDAIKNLMTDDNRKTFDLFCQARKRSVVPRVCGLMRSGIHRQTLLGNLGLAAAALVGKI